MRLNVLLVPVVMLGAMSPVCAQTSVDDIVKRSQEATNKYMETMAQGIVRIEADVGRQDPELGTGIVVRFFPDKIWILTALHVVKDARSIDIVFYSARPAHYHASRLDRRSDSLDLALLEVTPKGNPKLPNNFPAYQFLQNGAIRLGGQIYSVNGEWSLVPNTISRLSHDGDVRLFEYTNVSVGEGFSGGPVFDQYGNVLGMHDALSAAQAEDATASQYAVAVKIDSALETLEALGYAVPKAVPFSVPRLSATAVPTVPSQVAIASNTTSQKTEASEVNLYQKALQSSDPAVLEAAADKMSNPMFANILRMQAKALRTVEASTTASADTTAAMLNSRKRFEDTNAKLEADAAAHRGNYKQAFPTYHQLAESGDSDAMVKLGHLYYNGWGVPQDYAQAAEWFNKAAAAGETRVMSKLGVMYAFGEGVERNDKLAVEWDRKAAAVNDPLGMLGLGFMYQNGRGVPKDLNAAAEWYRKSAALGNEAAKENLRKLGIVQ